MTGGSYLYSQKHQKLEAIDKSKFLTLLAKLTKTQIPKKVLNMDYWSLYEEYKTMFSLLRPKVYAKKCNEDITLVLAFDKTMEELTEAFKIPDKNKPAEMKLFDIPLQKLNTSQIKAIKDIINKDPLFDKINQLVDYDTNDYTDDNEYYFKTRRNYELALEYMEEITDRYSAYLIIDNEEYPEDNEEGIYGVIKFEYNDIMQG